MADRTTARVRGQFEDGNNPACACVSLCMSHTTPPGITSVDPANMAAIPEPIEEQTPWPTLTPREREVAVMLVRGRKNSEIADALGVSVKTIDTHRANVLDKLSKRNNVELTRYAFRMGWASHDEEDQS